MASKKKYIHIPSTVEETADEDWLPQSQVQSQTKRLQRTTHALVLLLGLVLGVTATLAVIHMLEFASSKSRSAERHALESGAFETLDVNDIGFIPETELQSGDPVCGQNRHEALKAGCKYDLMASRWYTDECYNGDVLEQFMAEISFDWYWEPEHKTLATLDVALAGQYDNLWPLDNFHIMHCLYQWRRLHLAIIEHRHIDDDVYSYDHTLHCTRMIMNWPNEWRYGKNTTTLSTSGVSYCLSGTLGAREGL